MRRGQSGGWRGGPPNRHFRHRSGGNPGYRPYRPHAPGGLGPHRYPLKYNSPRVPPWNHHHQVNTSRSTNSEDDNSANKDETMHNFDKDERLHHYDKDERILHYNKVERIHHYDKDERIHHYDKDERLHQDKHLRNKIFHRRNEDPYQYGKPYKDPSFHDVFMESINYNSNTQLPTYWQNPQNEIPDSCPEPLLKTPPGILETNQSDLLREYNEKKRNRNRDYERQDYGKNHHDRQRLKHFSSEISQPLENNCLRPSTSNYFENNTPRSDDSKSFTKSVDDTVSIIKERMMNRHNPSYSCATESLNSANSVNIYQREGPNATQIKSNNSRQKRKNQNIKLSREFKNKVVGQLFNMDKDNMHKLMDNPNLSSKFEYAINSLITESQNSFNRHTRAAAEKSLFGDYIKNNTIYEDTFMKQMQCVLDPKETVVLSDIKPFVMEELNKFLQIDVFSNEYPMETFDENDDYEILEDSKDFQHNQDNSDNIINSEANLDFSQDLILDYNSKDNYCESYTELKDDSINDVKNTSLQENLGYFSSADNRQCYDMPATSIESTGDPNEKLSAEKSDNSSNINEKHNEAYPVPLFQNTAKQLSDDEDPFAELDNQYHVAVDPTLIDADYTKIDIIKDTIESPNTNKKHIKIKDISKNRRQSESENNSHKLQHECLNKTPEKRHEPGHIKKSNSTDKKYENTESRSSTTNKNNNRKSLEESPTHRKEKKRNIESNDDVNLIHQNVSNSQVLKNKEKSLIIPGNTKLTVKDKLKKQFDEYINMSPSIKVVKCKQIKLTNPIIKFKSNKKDQPASSPADATDAKTKLKTIDMFEQKPRKIQVHQSTRNTATGVQELKTPIAEKYKDKHSHVSSHKHVKIKRSVGTQVINKSTNRFTQTSHESDRKNKSIQTDEILKENHKQKAVNIYDRMKEIDLEIQVLLQEKFKLYNSLESKDKSEDTMTNVGMTVINVDHTENTKNDIENDISEDTIIDDIAKLSAEELEKIAFEGIESAEEYMPEDSPVFIESNKIKKKTKNSKIKKKKKKIGIKNTQNIIEKTQEEDSTQDTSKGRTPMKTRHRKNVQYNENSSGSSSTSTLDYSSVIKPCSVILIKKGLRELMDNASKKSHKNVESTKYAQTKVNDYNRVIDEVEQFGGSVVVEEIPVINEFHFQDQVMVISEDIVIDSNIDCQESVDLQSISLTDTYEEVVDNSSVDSGDRQLESKADTPPAKDSTSKIYDMDENDPITVSGHGDSIIAIECIENNFIGASANGCMYYFDNNGQLLSTIKAASNYGVSCLCIVEDKTGITVYAGSLDARIRYYDLHTGLEKGPECNVLSPIQSMDRAWDIIYVGTRMGFVHQFECKNGSLFPLSSKQFSDQPIMALKALKEGPRRVLLVASRTDNVTIKDAQSGLLLRTLEGGKMTIYSLLYEDGKVFCGNPSNQIQAFDFASGSHTGNLTGGRGCICLRSAGGVVFAGCYCGSVYVFQTGRSTPMAVLRGRSNVLLALAVHNTKLIVAYNDRSLYIWKIPVHILEEMIL